MAKGHATLSASGAYRWLACPGSIRLSEGLPSVSSVYADEGTAAHKLAEMCLQADANADKYLGITIQVANKGWEVTQEMADAVQVYLDTIRNDWAALESSGASMVWEQRFDLNWLYPGMFGRIDCMIDEPFGTLRVYDYKHGAGVPVDVEKNEQMMYYALGAAKGDAYEHVELVVVQPRAMHKDGPVRRYKMTIEDLMKWGKEVLLPGAKATKDPKAPLSVGDHCRFCPAIAVCPAQKEKAMTVAAEVFAPVPNAPPAPEALSYAELRKVLDVSDLIETWLNACRGYVKSLLENGKVESKEIGYKLVQGRASRSWSDEKAAEEYLDAILGKEAYITKVISVAQAEKVLKGSSFKKALEELTTTTRGKQMVPISDERDEIPAAVTAFEEVEL